MLANKERIYINKQKIIMVGFNINIKNIINNIKTTLLNVFLYISDVENLSLID